ncbi:MAG: hypothetical protein AAFU86_16480, partial [Pseudomonadota bacterium]
VTRCWLRAHAFVCAFRILPLPVRKRSELTPIGFLACARWKPNDSPGSVYLWVVSRGGARQVVYIGSALRQTVQQRLRNHRGHYLEKRKNNKIANADEFLSNQIEQGAHAYVFVRQSRRRDCLDLSGPQPSDAMAEEQALIWHFAPVLNGEASKRYYLDGG